ncbi:MAG: ImmA/IrrE family metallo-endopeptidase [Nitrospirae bacterium]|nr:ImmA/IrrE family metallo-endopeptidase [Nitrospirota bacterium]
MEEGISIPFIPYEEIRKKADEFLRDYHSDRSIPVPIEEIIEFQLGLNIVPLPGLHRDLELDGFVSSDLKDIFVNEAACDAYPTRYRFTLAHEVGHIFLHKHVFRKARFSTFSEWKTFGNSIPEKDYAALEFQAYAFAGLVLVPKEHLEKLTDSYVKKILKEGISLNDNWDFAWDRIAARLAKDFEVSSEVIDRRLKYDKIFDKYRK